GPGEGSGPSATMAGQSRPGPARARARQLPGRAGLLQEGGPGRRVAAGQPAHRLLVRARPLLGGTAAPGRPARPGPRRRRRAGGRGADQGDGATAVALLDEAVECARARHDRAGEAAALTYRGRAMQIIGDPAGAGPDIERALQLQTAAGDDAGLAAALFFAAA